MANTGSESMLNETTGGGVTENNAEKSSAISEIVLSGTNACSVAKTIVNKHSHTTFTKQQNFTSLAAGSSNVSTVNVSSSTSAALAAAAETAMSSIVMSSSTSSSTTSSMRKVHTLSFLHNEDLLSAKLSSVSASIDSQHQQFQQLQQQQQQRASQTKSLTLNRSISFNDQRRVQMQRSTIQRTESTRESSTVGRKISILTPIYNLQGFDSSSDLSL